MEVKTLSQFKSKLQGGGARPDLFEVSIPAFPAAVSGDWSPSDDGENRTFRFLCTAAQLPASTVGMINVPFRGRELKVAGERTFENWVVTVINDEDFKLRTAFEKWANALSRLSDNTGVTEPSSYMADAYVQQLGRGREAFADKNSGGEVSVLRTYRFYDIWPTNVGAIQLSYDQTGDIERFDVEFAVQYFTIGDSPESTGGNPGEERIN